MIADVIWNLGGSDTNKVYSNQMYEYERGTTVYTGRPTIWSGKIALAYLSDYGYAVDLNECKDKALYDYDSIPCESYNWIKAILGTSDFEWLLAVTYNDATGVGFVRSSGVPYNNGPAASELKVVPVLYLSSELGIESGDGSSSNPYKLSI